MIPLKLILLVFAFCCFALAAFGVNTTRVNLIGLGLAFWVLSVLMGGVGS